MQTGLPGDHREVGIHVEHARIGVAEEADPAILQRAQHGGRGQPVVDLGPGVRARRAVLFLQQPAHHVEMDAAAAERARDLGDTAGAAVRQPLARIGVLIIESGHGLQVEHQHRPVRALHRRHDLRGCGVGADVAEDEVDVFPREQVAGLARRRGRIDQPRADDLRARRR